VLVVDASFVVQASATVDGLRRVTRQRPIAPPLLWSEVTSVLHELRWRRAVSEQLADVALRNFRNARIGLRRPTRLYEHAWAIASQLGWAKTYDAEYVALARLENCPLLTLDGRLARAASRLVEIIEPKDL
jgi:predicted nucleic acid-binding protein